MDELMQVSVNDIRTNAWLIVLGLVVVAILGVLALRNQRPAIRGVRHRL